MNIAVLMGGTSGERAVSLSSGVEIARALREAGHAVSAVDTARGVLDGEEERALLEEGVRVDPPTSWELIPRIAPPPRPRSWPVSITASASTWSMSCPGHRVSHFRSCPTVSSRSANCFN